MVDHGRWEIALGDCSGAGSAIGLADSDAVPPCNQQHLNFTIQQTVSFNGKY